MYNNFDLLALSIYRVPFYIMHGIWIWGRYELVTYTAITLIKYEYVYVGRPLSMKELHELCDFNQFV